MAGGSQPRAPAGGLRRRFGMRKLKLFGLGCCKLVPHLDTSAVRAGRPSPSCRSARDRHAAQPGRAARGPAAACAASGATSRTSSCPRRTWTGAGSALTYEPMIEIGTEHWEIYLPLEHCLSYNQCDLIRELSGNPYRPLPVDPLWLHWNDGCIARMAHTIYDEERFEELPILADALEEAGCAEGPLLEHLRHHKGMHVRGCWAVDLLLGLHLPVA